MLRENHQIYDELIKMWYGTAEFDMSLERPDQPQSFLSSGSARIRAMGPKLSQGIILLTEQGQLIKRGNQVRLISRQC
jgi:hypothetical protein